MRKKIRVNVGTGTVDFVILISKPNVKLVQALLDIMLRIGPLLD